MSRRLAVLIAGVAMLIHAPVVDAQPVNEGATPDKPDILVQFDVDNPNVVIYAIMPGPGGAGSTDASATFTLNGNGSAYGTFEAHAHPDSGWASVDGWYVGYQGDLSSTFNAKGIRHNCTKTFQSTLSLEVVGVGPLEVSPAGDLVSGLYVYGEAAARSASDTWVVGAAQTFEGTAESLTITVQWSFEDRGHGGSLLADPLTGELSVAVNGGSTFFGLAESGSYDAASIGAQNQPGFGFAASILSVEVTAGTGFLTADLSGYTDQIPGSTSTWYTHPGYPGAP